MVEIGSYRLDLISDGLFEDDADTFVADVESAGRAGSKVRRKTRVRVGFNSLLVRGRGRTVVVDPGTGNKPRPEKVAAFNMQWPRLFGATLAQLGVSPEDVDTVILTHLHWDHCGASTRMDVSGIHPSYPNARYYVQTDELAAARRGIDDGDDGYLAADFEPLVARGLLTVINGDAVIAPGIQVHRVGGHSAGLQTVTIGDLAGPRAVYLSDLIPTAAQLPLANGLTYDVNPPELRESKQRVLAEAWDRHDLLLFVHAPRIRAGYLVQDAPHGYRLEGTTI